MSNIKIIDHAEIRVLAFDRPRKRNAVDAATRAELAMAFTAADQDPAVAGVVVTGNGEAFCAGQDLAEAQAFDPENAEFWVEDLRYFLSAIRDLDKLCVAAVNGTAAGAGMQVALLCDMRIGHPGVKIGQPEIRVGLASVIGVHLLSLILGHARTTDLALSGRLLDAEEALAIGMLTQLVDAEAVVDEAIASVRYLLQRPPNAFRLSKQRLREITQAGFDETFAAAARLQRAAYESGEPQRIMGEFLARRR